MGEVLAAVDGFYVNAGDVAHIMVGRMFAGGFAHEVHALVAVTIGRIPRPM